MQTRILRFESLPSTNLEVARLAAEGAPEGVCVVADEQTAGRGRLERRWISPKGAGLYFSILLRPQVDQSEWPLLTLMASLAVQQALAKAFNLETDIKWPNDVLADERKLCGVLAETTESPLGRAIVLGIGINLKDEAFPAELEEVATSVERASGRQATTDELIKPLVEALRDYYDLLSSGNGREAIIDEWTRKSSYASGKQVRVTNGPDVVEGTTQGLAADGALRIRTVDGELKIIHTGDVTRLRAID